MDKQFLYMTSRLSHTRLPWTRRSRAVGLSTLLLLIPALKRDMPRWKRIAFTVQAYIAYLSDYVYAGRSHISHGLDRWITTLNMMLCAPRAIDHGYAFVPLVCYYLSMESIRLQHREAYEFWHSMWHVVGAACLYA